MTRFLLVLFFIIGYTNICAKTVSFDIDWSQFRYDENKVLWEMYYSFPDTLLKYQYNTNEKAFVGELYIKVTINSMVNVETEKEWIVTNSVNTPQSQHKTDLLGQKDFILSPGQYNVQVNILDLNDSTTQNVFQFNLIIKKFNNNQIELSEIELSKFIENKDETSIQWNESFKKGKLYVVPNPTHFYFGDSLFLRAYYEVYNSKQISPSGFIIKYRILDAVKREELLIKQFKESISNGQSDIVALPINVLATGVYFFETTLSYPQDNPTDSITRTELFYVLNPEIPPNLQTNFSENVTFEKSEWSVMSEEQINKEFDKAKYIASQNEIELWKEITTTEAKQKFMFAFWNIRNTDTTKPYNVKLLEYRKLIDFANTYYSYGNMKDGWHTDRGRVLLRYGKPTQIDQTPSRGDYRPYEVWTYNDVQGGVSFYFVDLIGYGNFVLVHSTAIGEMRNDDWYKQYVPSKNTDGDINDQQNYNQGIIR
ncbi:MAG: GWxTD domain-containing protein [Bacteroidetes bacterium]|nr:MAG: GWxTD domain-containing protein [Bacteroidota bacterium]